MDRTIILRLGLCLLLILASPVPAQNSRSTAVVPVTGTVPGALGTIWRTEVNLYNSTGADVLVAVTLPGDPEGSLGWGALMSAGESVSFGDISQEAFGRSGYLSPLVIHTEGSQSVFISAVTYAIQGDRISKPQQIPVLHGALRRGVFHLGPVSFNQQLRTNIGIVNLGETAANCVVSVQRIAGRNLAVQRIVVPPRGMIHSPIQTIFPLLKEGTGFTVLVDPGAPDTYAYASMIRNSDSEATFFAPR